VKAERGTTSLPEVIFLRDVRGEPPAHAVGIGAFWYEPEIWALPLSPAAKVLYASLCSFLEHGEIHRHDLRGALKGSPDGEISTALEELVSSGLLAPTKRATKGGALPGYEVRSVDKRRSRLRDAWREQG
jgi:hypothetical protein